MNHQHASDSTDPTPMNIRSGYTLPVFATAAAIAALRHLQAPEMDLSTVTVDLLDPAETVEIPVEQVARLDEQSALAITRSDPGDNLDLTRHTPVWAWVQWGRPTQAEPILIHGGEGIGRQVQANDQPAIYRYARRSLQENLARWLAPHQTIQVTLILPEGRALAERTSNAAFGIVEGLSLLGTSGIAHPLSAPEQIDIYRQQLREKVNSPTGLVFCIGENGLALAQKMGIPGDCLVKTANWMGAMLVEAGLQSVPSILLFGYHGKLLKLAGGIFHTHHYVADARQAILTAHCTQAGLPIPDAQAIFASPTAEAALTYLRQLDTNTHSQWVNTIYGAIAQAIDQRAMNYIRTHSERSVIVGTVLFDRDRQIITTSINGTQLLQPHIVASE